MNSDDTNDRFVPDDSVAKEQVEASLEGGCASEVSVLHDGPDA